MKTFLEKKIVTPLLDLLQQGITPEKLALSVALGFIIGIIPLIGVSTAICALIAIMFDLNIVATQIVNYIAYPLQLVFYIPFIKAGENILGNSASGLTIYGIKNLFNEGFISAVKVLWYANLQGILVWVMITVPVTLAVYYLFRFVFRKFSVIVPAGE
ncbi:MAG TPA: DUF2062 domain-containing protein [Spirochaetota bacterium]|nr:DUF2062 domain-containing protein [Spirochaetota bacterium]